MDQCNSRETRNWPAYNVNRFLTKVPRQHIDKTTMYSSNGAETNEYLSAHMEIYLHP